MATGSQQGQKVTAGDKRTPEGLYLIIERKERYQLSSIYGPLAYVLDYPNEEETESQVEPDRVSGFTGQKKTQFRLKQRGVWR
jgi:murein L,D-transpeptidase YafK